MQWAKAGDFEGKEAEKAEKDTQWEQNFSLCLHSLYRFRNIYMGRFTLDFANKSLRVRHRNNKMIKDKNN